MLVCIRKKLVWFLLLVDHAKVEATQPHLPAALCFFLLPLPGRAACLSCFFLV